VYIIQGERKKCWSSKRPKRVSKSGDGVGKVKSGVSKMGVVCGDESDWVMDRTGFQRGSRGVSPSHESGNKKKLKHWQNELFGGEKVLKILGGGGWLSKGKESSTEENCVQKPINLVPQGRKKIPKKRGRGFLCRYRGASSLSAKVLKTSRKRDMRGKKVSHLWEKPPSWNLQSRS